MKKQLPLLLLLLNILFVGITFAQIKSNGVNDLPSVITPPSNLFVSPPGIESNTITVNGFDNFSLGVDFGEPHIVTNPKDPLNSICAFNINNLYITTNGYDWTKIIVSFPGFNVLGDPVLAFDSLGVAYYCQLYQNGSTYGVTTIKSTNKGLSWANASNVYSTTVGLADKEWIAADQTAGPYSNYVYTCWRQFGSSGMRFVRSTDRGVTWSTPLTFSGGQGAYVAVGANGPIQGGSVYFAALSGSIILVNRSSDGGQNFSSQIFATPTFQGPGIICAGRYTVKNCIRTDAFPRMSADNSFTSTRGNVYVVYAANPQTQDRADIFLVRSTDFGTTWAAPLRVNDDATTNDQWMPAISVDSKTGRIYISWFDSREDPNNLLTKVYGTVSTNGGTSFTPNAAISNQPFNPNSMAVGQPGGESYIGDYFGISAIGNTAYAVWMDGRSNNLGSFTGYFPDYAMLVNTTSLNLGTNDSANITIKVPSVIGPYVGRIKFIASLDTLPTSGSINLSFVNGKDSITAIPDSVILKVRVSGNVNARNYVLNILGKGIDGPPVHSRKVNVLVNTSMVTVGTNRPGIAEFKVNGVSYNTTQTFFFQNSTNVTVQAISPRTIGVTQYVFTNWSNGGDTTQTITINGNLNLTAFYKTRYRLIVSSSQGTAFGGNIYYDSGTAATFGVTSRVVINGGQTYFFRGWDGSGSNSYTSPDSSGIDSAVTVPVNNPFVETARWSTTSSISQIGSLIPDEYKLHQNYPNPFNPVAKIRFDITQDARGEMQDVKLIIFDALGREVEILVNENLRPGSYEAEWDASNYASGIYFYKITANNFIETKRMVLVK